MRGATSRPPPTTTPTTTWPTIRARRLAFNGASVTFESLAPNYQNWYDVYAQGGGLNGFTSSGTDPNAPHLGRNWVYEGEMAVTQGETSLTVNSGAAWRSASCNWRRARPTTTTGTSRPRSMRWAA